MSARTSVIVSVGLSAALAACGGGGGGSSPSAPAVANVAAHGTAVLSIPDRSTASSARKPQFVSPSASSVGVSVNGGAATFADVSPTSTLCTPASGTTGRTCTIPLTAFPGSTTFTFTVYDAANGGGKMLSVVSVSQTVAAQNFIVPVGLSGIPGSVVLSVPPINVATSVPVTVTVNDADGNPITGPIAYASPVALTNSDASGTLTLSKTTVNTPSDVVTLTYNGGSISSAASISASIAGLPGSKVTAASVLPLNYFPIGLSRTYGYTYTGTTAVTPVGPSLPTAQPAPISNSGTYSESVTGSATFAGQSNVQAVNEATLTGSGLYSGFGSCARVSGTSTAYQTLLANGTFVYLGCAITTGSFLDTTAYAGGLFYAPIPLLIGTTPNTLAPLNETGSYTAPDGIKAYTTLNTTSASGNLTYTQSGADGSRYIELDNADGSGSQTYTAGSAACGSEFAGNWDVFLPCSMSAASSTVTAPAGGNVTVTVSQTTTGSGTQTASVTIPVGTLFPTGVPAATYSTTESVGAPVATLPTACAVTAAYQGPVVPTTVTQSYWYGSGSVVFVQTETDYLAPGIGPICKVVTTTNRSPQYVGNAVNANNPVGLLPLQVPPYASVFTLTQATYLTNVGPPFQGGTINLGGFERRSPTWSVGGNGRPGWLR